MNITNLEMTQASMEIFGGFVCLLLGMMIIMNRYHRKSIIILKRLFFITAGIFFSESAAYIFRGNTDTLSVILNYTGNFAVFTLNSVLANIIIRYIYTVLNEKGVSPPKIYQRTANLCTFMSIAILIINIPSKWMYYFDASNYYHRNFMWYIYTFLALVCILTGCFLCIRHRKNISRATLASILSYSIFPIAAIVIQSYLYGYSIVNIGLGISIILMLTAYVYDWSRSGVINTDESEKKRKTTQTIVMFVIMGMILSVSISSCILSLKKMSEKSSESNSQVIAHMISTKIENQLVKPIAVAGAVSQDYSIKQGMKEKDTSIAEKTLPLYLESIRKGFGYQMVYAVSDITKAYYTYDGIIKFVDPENDIQDKWYSNHIRSGKHYNLEIDTDEANQWNLSVFVNMDVRDDNGDFLGVCGIGISVEEVIEILRDIENKYNVKINLTDNSGLIQIDSDIKRIETAYLDSSDFSDAGPDEFLFRKSSDHYTLTRQMKELGWYLVIEDRNMNEKSYLTVAIPSIIIFMTGLMVLGFYFSIIIIREQKTFLALKEKKKASVTDGLTGLLNRLGYQEECQKIEETGYTDDTVVAMFDINELKHVNDNLGHSAGDELINGAAYCITSCFSKYGRIFRIGGDEFAAILHCTEKQAEEAMNDFTGMTEKWKGNHVNELHVSKGFSVCRSNRKLSFTEHQEAADKKMYEDKTAYYIRSGKDRRKRR